MPWLCRDSSPTALAEFCLFAWKGQWGYGRGLMGRKFYRVVEAQRTENGRCILVTGPKERVSRGPGFVGARFGT